MRLGGRSLLYVLASDVRWSKGAISSRGAGASTSGAPSTGPDSRYIYNDWVSDLSNKKLGFISCEFKLGNLARWVVENERPLLPPPGYMTFSEAILKTGVFLPVHPFVVQVLDYFDIVPFQLPPNSYRLIVAFYIVFLEYCGVALSVVHFAFMYGLTALAKHAGFWYLIGRCDSTGLYDCLAIRASGSIISFSIPHNDMGSSKQAASDKFFVY